MIFNSVTFLLFLAGVTGLYWTLGRRARLWMVFVASLVFYGFWRVDFLPVMLFSVAVNYFGGLAIAQHRRYARAILRASVALSLLPLAVFKYSVFVAGNMNALGHWLGAGDFLPVPEIILPLGISFYTFQSISYTVDVYRRSIEPERDFVLFADYVLFFPQLVAGPILRAREVIWQLDRRPAFRISFVAEGFRRILVGLFLKVVLADNIAGLVDEGFLYETGYTALDVWVLAFLFGFQIYFDFSAYSHVAIGSARLMGISFPENFNFPYVSNSPREFWRRWHISLSSWIRDYLYLPLTGQSVDDRSTGGLAGAAGQSKRTWALVTTMLIMGLWHGANWTFVIWGIWHAGLVLAQRGLGAVLKVPAAIGWAVTLPLVMLAWIPFRAETPARALAMLGRVVTPSAYFSSPPIHLPKEDYLVAALVMILVLAAWAAHRWVVPWLRCHPWPALAVEFAVFSMVTPFVFIFLRPTTQFIYFQF